MRNITIRTKLILGMSAILLLLFTVVTVLFYRTSTGIIVENINRTMTEAVFNNVELIDQRLNVILEKVNLLNVDYDFYELIMSAQKPGSNQPYALFSKLVSRYFSELDEIVCVNLTAPYFVSVDEMIYYPYASFTASALYAQALNTIPHTHWAPTQPIGEKAQVLVYSNTVANQKRNIKTISLVRKMNSATVVADTVIMPPSDIPQPCLIVDIDPALYQNALSSALVTENSYYMVHGPGGALIATSDDARAFEYAQIDVAAKGAPDGVISVGDRPSLVFSKPSSVQGWLTTVVVPMEDLTGMIRAKTLSPLIVILSMTIFLTILLVVLATRVSAPVRLIAEATSSGDFRALMEIDRTDELGRISRNIRDMNETMETYIRENAEMARREQEATIMFLESQFNPHFLRNTLNRINLMAIEARHEPIAQNISALSGMLQYVLDMRVHFVFFYQDMEQLDNYIALIQAQQNGKISVYRNIDAAIYGCIVPKLLLQPFVENAVLHGFESMGYGCILRISGYLEEGRVVLVVEDNGKGIDEAIITRILNDPTYEHIGCANVNRRLQLLYGDAYGIEITNGAFTTVRVTLPYVTENAEAPL